MKTVTAGMTALFAKRKWFTAKLFTFTLVDGTVLRYCSGDQDLTVGGSTYSCGGSTGPYWERGSNKAKTHWGLGTSVDTITFDVIPGSGAVEGLPFQLAVRFGLFDGADFTYQRINMASPGDTSAGAILMFGGRVAQVDYSNSVATFSCNSHLELLNVKLPRNIYQAGCLNTLFDSSCALAPSSFVNTGAVASSPPALSYGFPITGIAASQAVGFFNLGKLQFTSGKNAGLWRNIQQHTAVPAQIYVFPPFPYVPAAADTFNAYPGCDKQFSTCVSKFNNRVNFRGFPDTPQAETAL